MMSFTDDHIAPYAAGEGHTHLKMNSFAAQPGENMQQGSWDPHILNPFIPKDNPYKGEDPARWANNMISNAPCVKVAIGSIHAPSPEPYIDTAPGGLYGGVVKHTHQANIGARLMPAEREYHSFHDPETNIQNKTGGVSKTDAHIKEIDMDKRERALLCGAIGLFILCVYWFR
jgi:hypothetical protein